MTKRGGYKFDDRKREILAAIVRAHIATGQPVGSFALAQQSSERLSSATIRNICAELEEEGFLSHPHTSAGRMPTDRGYRYYVDNSVASTKLSRSDAARIEERLLDEESLASPDVLMERTSQLLSQLSNNVGIVVSPSMTKDILHHVEFLKLPDSRILVITVSNAGRVQDRVIRVDEEFTQDELNSTGRYLAENFSGWTLAEIRDELLRGPLVTGRVYGVDPNQPLKQRGRFIAKRRALAAVSCHGSGCLGGECLSETGVQIAWRVPELPLRFLVRCPDRHTV